MGHLLLEEGQSNCQHGVRRGRHVHQRMQQVIPSPLKSENGQRRKRRLPQREINLPEDLDERSAVDTRRIDQVTRDREKILAEQKCSKSPSPKRWEPERNARPDQMQILKDDEVWDQSDLGRNEQR